MAIAKMKRLRAIALARERDELLTRLQSLGCVELSEPEAELADPAWNALLHRDSAPVSEVRAQAAAVDAALAALKKYAGVKSGLFIRRRDVKETEFLSRGTIERALAQAGEINEAVRQLQQIQTERLQLEAQRVGLEPWAGMDLPLETSATRHATVTFGLCPGTAPVTELHAPLEAAAPAAELLEISADKEQRYLLLLCHKTETEAALHALRPLGFSPHAFPGVQGTAGENLDRIAQRLTALDKEEETLKTSLASMGGAQQGLRLCADRLQIGRAHV